MFTRKISVLIVSMGLVLCASCGGGGGGGAAPAPTPTPPPNPMALPITADNAQDITEVVLESVIATIDIVDFADVVGLPALGSSNQGIAKLTVRDIYIQITSCDTGEVTVTWNDADDNLELSTGDTLDADFDMCFLADSGTTLDGAVSFTNIVVVGEPEFVTPWRLAMTFSFDNLTGMDSSGTSIIDGSLNVDIASDDNVVIELSVSTPALTAQDSGMSVTLSDYLLTQLINVSTSEQRISADGTLTSTELEGSVSFETQQDFVIFGDDNPSSGQMLIADANSSVLVTVLDNLSVQLEIDLDRDGTIDQTIVVTWTELDVD
ncbi:MAG: hypothetical protein GTN98_15045 [Woeseiaceae bacterium]|nr:hypothetical protein [Woeseiaceae bacterium]